MGKIRVVMCLWRSRPARLISTIIIGIIIALRMFGNGTANHTLNAKGIVSYEWHRLSGSAG